MPDVPVVVDRIRQVAGYRPLFAQAFGTGDIDIDRMAKAIACFERTVMSGEVRMLDTVTIYGRIGDACAYACAALTLAALLAGLSTRTRTQ